MRPRTVKLGEVLTSLIEPGGYTRNRKAILATVILTTAILATAGASAAALAQSATGSTRWPERWPTRRAPGETARSFTSWPPICCAAASIVSSWRTATHTLAVSSFRSLLTSPAGGDQVHQFCDFRGATTPVMSGAGFYQLDIGTMALQEPALHAQVGDYVDEEQWLGYAMRPNSDSKSDILMGRRQAKAARATFDALWAAGDPL